MIQEAYDSLRNFRVTDPTNPPSWEEAFNTYETKVFIAGSGSQSTEKDTEVLIAGLESYLVRSGDLELKAILDQLESKANEDRGTDKRPISIKAAKNGKYYLRAGTYTAVLSIEDKEVQAEFVVK